jgi:acetyl-CoA acyltransferase
MKTAVIVAAVRTPVGRSSVDKGYYRSVRGDDLAAHCVKAIVEQTGIDPTEIDDVRFGTTQPTGELGLNVGRTIAMLAGLPFSTAGCTVNRLCGSSLEALHAAVHSIMAGAEDVQIVGGVEHMQHLPMDHGLDANPGLFARTSQAALHMGATAEFLAATRGISREKQDVFALASHQKAAAAIESGRWEKEILPTLSLDVEGLPKLAKVDQCIRPDTTLEKLASLPPAFTGRGSVTAGNASPINDGAAALLVMSEEKAKSLGLKPLVKVVSTAVAGIEPTLMGLGPTVALPKALQRAGLKISDLDQIELNEAFAVQCLACIEALDLPAEKVNPAGGALAIGHPLGASGARIMTTLIHGLIASGKTVGAATMCIGLGQGIATVVQRV